jgi:CBS domain-containing protein
VGIRIIELIEDEFDLPAVPWCWMVFGSEGRLEQTFATDQDNGLIFLPGDPEETEHLRESFVPFAQAVNGALHTCGFERCRGDIMAGNPSWCLSQDEWQSKFTGWMATPEPEALLHSTIFFDFRPLYGRYELADGLRKWLMPLPSSYPRFLRGLAEQALACSPALGWTGNFIYDKNKDYPRTIDLKLSGARPFVDAARIWSLAHGVWATNTGDRLREAGRTMARKPEDTAAAVEAFQLLQRFRIQQQMRTRDPERVNRLDPSTLNDLQRLMLKEAFKQGKKLQLRLKQDYDL